MRLGTAKLASMKNSRLLCNFSFLIAGLGLGTGAFAQDKPGCLDGICVNTSIATLPKNTAWTPLDPQTLRSYFTPRTKDAARRHLLPNALPMARSLPTKSTPAKVLITPNWATRWACKTVDLMAACCPRWAS